VSSNSFAITYTVKNEATVLPLAIAYHVAAGCSLVYLFWDGTTDDADKLIEGLPVVARPSVRPEEMVDPPEWVTRLLPWWTTNMDVRKQINTYYAAKWAAEAGIEWLASIDVDELILMDRHAEIDANHITAPLSRVPAAIDQVLMPNMDVIPTAAACEQPFVECVYFQNRFRATEEVWRYSRAVLIRLLKVTPSLVAWYDYLFFWLRYRGDGARMMFDPKPRDSKRAGARIPAGYFLGYSSYKSLIRTSRIAGLSFSIHSWVKETRPPRTMRLGNVLHYDMPGASYFARKFRQRSPDAIIKAFHLRYRLAQVARECTDEELEEFFRMYIAVTDEAQMARLKRKGIAVEVQSVARLLRRLMAGDAAKG